MPGSPIAQLWTSKPPEKLEDIAAYIAREELPILRQIRAQLNILIDFFDGENMTMAFDSVADLRASDLQAKGAIVSGHTTPGDGLGGVYVYVASDTTSPDNDSTIIVRTADSRRYYQL